MKYNQIQLRLTHEDWHFNKEKYRDQRSLIKKCIAGERNYLNARLVILQVFFLIILLGNFTQHQMNKKKYVYYGVDVTQ